MSTGKFASAKKRRAEADRRALIERVRQLRIARFGRRGQAAFCKALGLSPSTYHYYENNRVPSPSLLVRMAQAAHANLTWLLTGQGSMDLPEAGLTGRAGDILDRVSRLVDSSPSARAALSAFVELLENIEGVEHRRQISAAGPTAQVDPFGVRPRTRAAKGRPDFPVIPVLGRTAAAVPQFWTSRQEGAGLTNQLAEAIRQLGGRGRVVGTSHLLGGRGRPASVALIQLARPAELAGLSVSEVLEAARLTDRWPDAFALRVDGDSMQPVLEPNDIVILSPAVPAEQGRPAVVQLAGQVGLICKVYRRDGDQVRLIPANEDYPTTAHSAADVLWALKVLARVRV